MLRLKDILSHEGLSNLLSVSTYGNGWPDIRIKRSEYHLAEEDKYDCIETSGRPSCSTAEPSSSTTSTTKTMPSTTLTSKPSARD